jgi:tRNA pseudouridine38-40 synthase
MNNIKITLEYDGTNYQGWQYQKHTKKTIQQVLEDRLTKLNKSKVKVYGAGRTDSGVHALGQTANFHLEAPVPIERLPIALNSMLPDDIVCKKAENVSDDFHARYYAQGKKYRYRILNKSLHSVFTRNYVYTFYQKLDLSRMKKAVKDLEGEHDFSAFKSSGSDVSSTIRTIEYINITKQDDEIWLEIIGDGFLYNMVRIIVGTLLEIGVRKIAFDDIPRIMESRNRRRAGFTAPAKGLTLDKVYY